MRGCCAGGPAVSKDLWLDKYERTLEYYAAGKISEDEARAKLRSLGLDPHEIDDHLDAALS